MSPNSTHPSSSKPPDLRGLRCPPLESGDSKNLLHPVVGRFKILHSEGPRRSCSVSYRVEAGFTTGFLSGKLSPMAKPSRALRGVQGSRARLGTRRVSIKLLFIDTRDAHMEVTGTTLLGWHGTALTLLISRSPGLHLFT